MSTCAIFEYYRQTIFAMPGIFPSPPLPLSLTRVKTVWLESALEEVFAHTLQGVDPVYACAYDL